ncbi:MAG: energy-coupling factor transporter ATPase [Anaerofustis stercorihominis]|nr:energy-coupling factor transporter ATPase [Anaerofustis stercorihominis]
MSIIEVKDLVFAYDSTEPDKKALDGVSLKINEGEFVGIVGHNGSGKSTLAKLLNGLLLPTSGDVLVAGMNTKDESSLINIRRNVGMVFQNPDNQMVATIVEEDVAFGVENLGIAPSQIRSIVDNALHAVDMYEFRGQKPHQLSGGQKQRIAIAGIIAMKPKCIVFDESTAMLDPVGRREVLEQMHRLNKEDHVTIIFITHYMEELIDVDRIIIMNDGKVHGEGTPKEIFANTEELKALRLNVPEIVELADGLRSGGLDISHDILTKEGLVDAICQLK